MMKIQKIKVYGVSILIALAVGVIGGIVTRSGLANYEQLIKPALTPPSAVFPIVWSILYVLMGISAAQIYLSSNALRNTALSIYSIQLAANFIWSFLFFGLGQSFLAFLWLILLWVLIFIMIIRFYQIKPSAGILQIPYLVWVTFAGYLNLAIWLLNK